MKVSELIEKLQALTPEQKEMEVYTDEMFPNVNVKYIEEDDVRGGRNPKRGIVLCTNEE